MATVRIQLRRGTAAEWTAVDPVLAPGEMGLETDTGDFKFGDGNTAWSSLNYALGDSVDDYIPLSEKGVADGVATLDSNGLVPLAQLPGAAALDAEVSSAISDHNADTTNVHGIADTSLLATKSYADQAEADAKSYSDAELGTHNADTTNVHGIADTSLLVTTTGSQTLTSKSLTSPILTGTPTAPTAILGTDTTQIATTEFVQDAIEAVVGAAPAALNTLAEIATSLNNDDDLAGTLTTSISTKVSKAGDTMSGALDMGTNKITNLGTPTLITDAVTKGYLDGVIQNSIDSYVVETSKIANEAVTTEKINNGAVTSAKMADNSVTAVKLADGAVSTSAKLENSVVTTDKINNLAVTTEKINDLSVTDAKIADNAVTSAKLSDGSVNTSAKLADSVVTTDKINNSAVTTLKVADLAITDTKLADGAVGSAAKIADSIITTAKINNSAVTSEKINNSAVTENKIADLAVTTAKIVDLNVTAAKLAAASVIESKIASDAVTTAKIADGSVTSEKIANETITNSDISTSAGISQSKIANLTSDLNAKAPLASPTFTGTVVLPSTTSIGNISSTELGYVDGVTSSIQTQIDSKLSSSVAASTYAPINSPTFTGTVAGITKSMVGLANVDNTSDANKPVSTATQSALDAKASLSGAVFTGSVEIDQNLVVDGNLTVNGTTFNASSTSIVIEDNMVQLAHQNSANTVDLGLIVAYNDGTAKHAGIVRDVSANKWKLFEGVTDEPSTTVNFAQGTLDDLEVADITASSATIGNVSNTELQYLDGVTSAIQPQLNSKAPIASPTFTGTVTVAANGIAFTDRTQTKAGVPSLTPILSTVSSNTTLDALGLDADVRDSLVPLSGSVNISFESTGNAKYAIGSSISFYQSSGTGANITGNGVTILSTPGSILRTTNSTVTATKIATSTWLLAGDLRS